MVVIALAVRDLVEALEAPHTRPAVRQHNKHNFLFLLADLCEISMKSVHKALIAVSGLAPYSTLS